MQPVITLLKGILLSPYTWVFVLLILAYYLIANSLYKKTEYYKTTHNGFLKMRLDKGLYGEYLIYDYLCRLPGGRQFLFNVYLPKDKDETTEIDVLLIHNSGIYVFESKNYSGWIYGEEKKRQWTQTLQNGQKNKFKNPINQNESHIKWLKNTLSGFEGIAYHSIIVFSERCTLKKIELTEHKAEVIKRGSVKRCVETISKKTGVLLTDQQIQEIYDKLYPFTQVSEELKQKHIDDIKKDKPAPAVETAATPLPEPDEPEMPAFETVAVQNTDDMKRYCPKCGKEMVLMTAKSGENAGKQFWGCTGYPGCRNVINIKN